MERHARLVDREVIPCAFEESRDQWDNDHRRVARDVIEGQTVSTVFLVIDHGWNGVPLWFETMIFGGPDDQFCERYTTWEQAKAGHDVIVAKLKAGERVSEPL